ncbi:MAG: tryptophan synthase subunit alpha [Bacteroidetes bacterium]|nr:tryptophan synthase subunit alpha [Bacteroidota bacterium]
MTTIANYISGKNNKNEKVLSVFLTSGFPDKNNFVELALRALEAGADMLEIGFPFSDPLADGPIIQHSSQIALENGINITKTFNFIKEIRSRTDKPLILMGYANPVLSYGIEKFAENAKSLGVNGVIIPDIPIEEYENFYNHLFDEVNTILLVTPTTSNDRIKLIDEKSSGFIYCVSVSGTTGITNQDKITSIEFVKRTRSIVKKNKMLVGFGISSVKDAQSFAPYCDGIIVGSAVIKSLMNDSSDYVKTLDLIKKLKQALV